MSVATRTSPDASAWFVVSVGSAIRGTVRREIEGAAWGRGLDIQTDESKGFLRSTYRFTVRGDSKTVTAFARDAEVWFKEVAAQ